MREILGKLNKVNGIRGSMVVNRDGIVVASDFSVDADEAGMGAVTSSILAALDGALKRINMGKFTRFIITGSENKIAVISAGQAVLLVLLQTDVNMGLVNVEIKEAAEAVRANSKM
ncbi:MAG TPA: roadblock/LC7 domain-containing protein [Planctomycetota bacterium]|nr:roadblock/LC7 domain-containing protein [Planctomycetota bacterium]